MPFGGAGAVHAASVAEELGMTRIFVPPRPGAFSALGLLCTDIVHDYVRSELRPMELVPPEHAEVVFQELEARGVAELKEEGIAPDGARFERELDVRYTGQGYELRVSLDGLGASDGLSADDMDAARNRFDDHHEKIHGHAAKDRSVEIVSYRVRLRVAVPKYEPVPVSDVTEAWAPAEAVKGTRVVYFTADEATETTLYERDALPIGARIDGPAIVEQFDSTIVVPQSWVGRIDGFGNLILSRER